MARVATGPIPHPPQQHRERAEFSHTAVRPPDRRRDARQGLEVLGVLTAVKHPDNALDVAVLNVSLHGCAFRAPVAFRQGVLYLLRIGSGPLHLTSRIRIISSRDRADGQFDIGARFA